MKTLVVLLLVALSAATTTKTTEPLVLSEQVPQGALLKIPYPGFCDNTDVTHAYRISQYYFSLELYKKIFARASGHFMVAPFSIWKSLAALVEGADPVVQQQLFKLLSLPNDPCTRQKYYNIMNTQIVPGYDIKITAKRTLVLDENLTINQHWLTAVYKNSMLEVTSAPIKRYPLIAANYMRQVMSAPLRRLNLEGNSVILDSMEYDGLWTTAFDDAVIQRAPFYDQLGHKIGSVDLMTMRKRVRMGYVPEMNMKIIELPVGVNSRYLVYMGLILSRDNNLLPFVERFTPQLVIEILENLRESRIPIEVAIPRFTMTSDIDVRTILEDVGLSTLFTDPAATRYVSAPAALPSSYEQRATVTFNKYGVSPTLQVQEPSYNASTGLDPILGRDFIGNKPLLFAMLDAETYTYVFAGAFNKPTYNY